MKYKKISKDEVIQRIKKNKQVFGLSESFYLNDEWTDITNSCVDEISTYYRIFAKQKKGLK